MKPLHSLSTPLRLTLASGLALGASAQSGDEPAGPSTPSPAVPVHASTGPLQVPPEDVAEELRDATVQGPWREVPVVDRDDAVPQIVDDLVVPGPEGDRRIAGVPRDPFFLSFAAGAHYPPAGERVDPALAALAASARVDARPDDVVYAFVMFSRRITPARIAELEALGLRDLGFHPHHTRRVALPVGAIDAVAALPFVRWVGLAREWQKVHPVLAAQLEGAAPGARLELWVSLFESDLNADSDPAPTPVYESSDPNGALVAPQGPVADEVARTRGWQERALTELGVELGEYLEGARSFRARVDASLVDELVSLDFVQFLSPEVGGRGMHDESMPLVSADYARATYDGANDSAVVVGVADSGITIGHQGFVPIAAAGWDFTTEGLGTWQDLATHGSHVSGTIAGDGSVEDSWAGAAPGIGRYGPTGRFFHYKILDAANDLDVANWNTFFTYISQGWTDTNGNATPKPMIVNHSWGSDQAAGGWFGTEATAIAWDNEVFDNRQLHVFAAGNYGSGASSLTLQASAKNTLSVGGVIDFNSASQGEPGSIWSGSSRGPVADGRWKPSVVAPATSVRSISGGTASGYNNGTGTSMATPHVSGVAAQLLDHYSFLRTRPYTTAALLMATATTKDDEAIDHWNDTHLDVYGAGRVNADRAHYNTSQQDMYFWAWSSANGSSTYEVDVPVLQGATRLTAALVYHEEGASPGAGSALINDWDMWIDAAPFTAGGNTGEFFAHQNAINNVELRTIDGPGAVTHRIKVYPDSVSSTCRIGLAVSVQYGDTTPDGSLIVFGSDGYVQPGDTVNFKAWAINPSSWASGVFLDTTTTGDADVDDSRAVLKDGSTASFMNNFHAGRDVLVGDIRHGQSRLVEWDVHWDTEGTKTFQVDASSDNWIDKTLDVQVVVDGTAPTLATNMGSTSHAPMTWSKTTQIDFTWNAANDALSGVDGYGVFVNTSPTGAPATTKDIEAVTSYSETVSSSTFPWYLKLRTVDNSGNWTGGFAVSPGYLVDNTFPTGASNLASSSHTPGVTSCDATVDVSWGAASDLHSGLQGYLIVWNHTPINIPLTGELIPAGTETASKTLADGTWYAHLRTIDVAGNMGPTAHAGPFVIDQMQWSTYCTSKVTSSLCTPAVTATGPILLSDPTAFRITGTQLEQGQNGIGFFGLSGQNAAPFQGGFLCVKAPVYRLPLKNTGGAGACQGALQYTLADLVAHPAGGALIDVGAVVNMQFWFRDTLASFGSGLSDAIEFVVCK